MKNLYNVLKFHKDLSPEKDLIDLHDELMQLFTYNRDYSRAPKKRYYGFLTIDINEGPDHYTVKADLPGVSKENLEISISDNILNIRGKRDDEPVNEHSRLINKERFYGNFKRSILLEKEVDPQSCAATLKNGVLTITLQKTQKNKAQNIEIM
jgi:HSP20 family protein